MEMLRALSRLSPMLEELHEKGSKLAVSDVGCAAAFGASALMGALMNLLVNTRLMQDRAYASALEKEALYLEREGTLRLIEIYNDIMEELRA